MELISFRNSRVVLSDSISAISSIGVADGRIVQLSVDENDPAAGTADHDSVTVVSGFIDVHIHGAAGIDVNEADAGGLFQIAAFLAKNGVTSWVPTLVPDSDANYERSIREIDRLMEQQLDKPVAQAVGVHYEGVFACRTMCGALRPAYFKTGKWALDGGVLPRLKQGVHMTTLAPEIDGGTELIEKLVNDGWVVSIGHARADTETLDRAFAAGARHMTHFFNAMTGIHHRDLGVAGWGLANADVTFDIIADGIHVHPKMLGVACRSKSPENVTLISDSVAPTGLGDGEYELWGEKITVTGGRTQNERGSIAGSVITMHDAVKRMLSLGFSEVETAKMASSNPARLLGLDDRGGIEVGKRTDLVGVDASGKIVFTMIGGETVLVGRT